MLFYYALYSPFKSKQSGGTPPEKSTDSPGAAWVWKNNQLFFQANGLAIGINTVLVSHHRHTIEREKFNSMRENFINH